MNALTSGLKASPLLARAMPFVLFLALTSFQGGFGIESHYWIYLIKCVIGVWMLWGTWSLVSEMRWHCSLDAVIAGVVVFALWIVLDIPYPKLTEPDNSWDLPEHFDESFAMVWFFVSVRLVGSTLLVPMLEEVFYRSFLYRYIMTPKWLFAAHNQFDAKSFLLTSIIFGLTHSHWIAGILCGMIYQLLVIRTNRLGDAIAAHAITNLLLGLWIVTKGFGYAEFPQWHLW